MTRDEHRQAVADAERELDKAEPHSNEHAIASEKTLQAIQAWENELEEKEKTTSYSSAEWHKLYANDLKDERQELESTRERIFSKITISEE